jgi:hypothetical protein
VLPVPVFGSAGDCCRAKQLFLSEVPARAEAICGLADAQEKAKESLTQRRRVRGEVAERKLQISVRIGVRTEENETWRAATTVYRYKPGGWAAQPATIVGGDGWANANDFFP